MFLGFGMSVCKAFSFPSDFKGEERSKFGDVGGGCLLALPHFWDQREKGLMFHGPEESDIISMVAVEGRGGQLLPGL